MLLWGQFLLAVAAFTTVFYMSKLKPFKLEYKPKYFGECSCGLDQSPSNNYSVVILEKPLRPFHSHHWFHVGEYYLSQNRVLGNRSVVPKRKVYLVPEMAPLFNTQLSKMSLFLILLSFDVSHVDELLVLDPDTVLRCGADSTASSITTHSTASSITTHSTASSITTHSAASSITTDYRHLCTTPAWSYDASQPLMNRLAYRRHCTTADVPTLTSPTPTHTLAIAHTLTPPCLSHRPAARVGAAPAKPAEWFTTPLEAEAMRHKIASLCHCSAAMQTQLLRDVVQMNQSSACPTNRKLVVYQRDLNRKFVDLHSLLEVISGELSIEKDDCLSERPRWAVSIVHHDESVHPCTLHHLLKDADMVLTTHGFQSIGLLFLPRGSLLFELFPYKYFKPTYQSLSRSYGVQHRHIQRQSPTSISREVLRPVTQDFCMGSNACRSYARGDDVQVEPADLRYIIDTMRQLRKR